MSLKLPELVDIPSLQLLMDRFHSATGIPVGIIGSDGEMFVATGWQEICTAFHRSHPVTAERCRQSDNCIKTSLDAGKYIQYKCKNGLWDLAKPIIVAGEHLATIYLGQFRYEDEEIDEEFFRAQAREFGFDQDRYLAALKRIPVFSREKVQQIMDFYTTLVDCYVKTGFARFSQAETEKTLRESEERYRALFEGANDAIITIRDGRIVNCNKMALELFRCGPEQLIGKGPENLSPFLQPDGKDSEAKAREMIAKALAGPSQIFEWRHCRGDETIFDAEVSLNRLEYGGKNELLAIMRDVTERKQAEQALKLSEAEKSLILNSSMDLIIHYDADMKILWGNQRALNSVDMEAEELVGQDCWKLWHQRTEPCYGCPVIMALETGEPREAEVRTPDGRIWDIRGFPVKDDAGRVNGVVEFCLEITGRKRMEEEIEILNTDLAARACELEQANRELEAFGYTVSHDLRSPLTGIQGYCQVLLELCGDRLGEDGAGYIREISKSAEKMDDLITTMLDFSRLSRCAITREEVDLTAIAKTLAAQLRMNEPERNATFAIAEGAKTAGDPKLLRVVLENLIGNAWKYTSRQDDTLIELGKVAVNGSMAFFVRDNGPGFDMAQADKLFSPFLRLPGAAGFSGHGIGLATVQRIIQHHGGRVWGEGEPGKGATFYFTV
ncbi:MAG: PocR ligand-binding domain-containing protein [Geobacter sp.]|nr:PocR ligand-binding domain-containing protein [Geobacter sp.]